MRPVREIIWQVYSYYDDPAFVEEFQRAKNNTGVNDIDVPNHNVDDLKFDDSLIMIDRGAAFKERVTVKKRFFSGDIKLSAVPESKGESMYEIEFNNKERMVVSPNLISEKLVL